MSCGTHKRKSWARVKTLQDPIDLLKEAGCEKRVIEHCIAVKDLALIFAENADADTELVKTGAILHDIGRSKTHSIAHGQAGAEICRGFGLSEEICLIIERHIGAGLTAEECQKEGLIPKDCIPVTIEEKIVAHSDNLIKGIREITIEERLKLSSNLTDDIKNRMKKLAEEIEIYR